MSRPAVLVSQQWLEDAVNVIERLAREQATVTAEDLRKHHEAPENANQVGSAFKIAAHRKIITTVDFRPSRDKSRRGGAVRVWALHPRLKDAEQ